MELMETDGVGVAEIRGESAAVLGGRELKLNREASSYFIR